MSDKVTARPWEQIGNNGIHRRISDHYAQNIAITDGEDRKANARHIVKCVNNHERLVEALREFEQWFSAVGLDHIPNDVYHDRGGFAVSEKARKLLNELDT